MNQETPNPKVRDLSQWLLSYETTAQNSSGENTPALFRVTQKLRRTLSTLAGAAGFRALLDRALTLAKREAHGLRAVQVDPAGSLDGLGDLHNDEDSEAGAILIAHLLGLLITFIGESLTLRLVRDTWPDSPFAVQIPEEPNKLDPTR